MQRTFSVAVTCTAVCAACVPSDDAAVGDPASPESVRISPNPHTLTLDEPLFRVGGSAASGPTAFGLVSGSVIDAGGRLWVADQLALHIVRLDRSGRVVDVVGRRGGGPGEFQQIEVLGWSAGRVVAYDAEQDRVVLIAPETEASSTERLRSQLWNDRPKHMMGVGPRGEHVFIPIDGIAGVDPYEDPREPGWFEWALARVVVESPDTTYRTVLTGSPGTETYWDGEDYLRHPLTVTTQARVHADTVALVGTVGGDVLVSALDGGDPRALNMGEQAGLPPDDAALARIDRVLEAIPAERRRFWASRELILDRGLPARHPFFDRVVMSADGVMWLRRTEDAGAETRRWDVMTLRGTHLGTAVLPQGENVLAAGPGLVATRSRDDYGADVVAMYEHPFGRGLPPRGAPEQAPGPGELLRVDSLAVARDGGKARTVAHLFSPPRESFDLRTVASVYPHTEVCFGAPV